MSKAAKYAIRVKNDVWEKRVCLVEPDHDEDWMYESDSIYSALSNLVSGVEDVQRSTYHEYEGGARIVVWLEREEEEILVYLDTPSEIRSKPFIVGYQKGLGADPVDMAISNHPFIAMNTARAVLLPFTEAYTDNLLDDSIDHYLIEALRVGSDKAS